MRSTKYLTDRDKAKTTMKTAAKSLLGSIRSTMYSQEIDTNRGSYVLPEVYDETLGQFTNYDEKFKSQLSAAENLTTNTNLQFV